MKKTILSITLAIISLSLTSQDLGTIVKKYEKATGTEKLNSFKTVLMEGSLDMMGMSMSMVVKEKRPDKIKTVMVFSGMEMVTVVNGDKGYQINPMMGSSEAVALDGEQIAQAKSNKNLSSGLSGSFKEGKAELVGEESYRGTDCYKILMKAEPGDIYVYIAKDTYLTKGLQITVNEQGMTQQVESVMSDYKSIDGVMMAMKVDAYVSGTYGYGVNFTKVEFNNPIDDSEFEIK